MDIEGLKNSPIGRLVPIQGRDARLGAFDYFAYVPNPLPSSLALEEHTIGVVADAAMALGRLDSAAGRLPNPDLLVSPTLHKEAVSTSALEGTFATLTEVLEGELIGAHSVSAQASEVINYIEAAHSGFQLIGTRPISLRMLCDLQKIIVAETRGDAYDAGRLRERQVFIGPERGPIEKARFVPCPHGDGLKRAMADWEQWIHADSETHVLVKVALGHYQFEAIHPFSDGNGRLGRLVVALQLMEGNVLKYPLLNIAEWLEPRKDEYQDNLLKLSKDGDFDHWLSFFCSGIREQAEASVIRIDGLLRVRDAMLEQVRAIGTRGGTAYRVAEELIGFPIVDVPWVAKWHKVTYQTAREAVERLVTAGVLRHVKRPGKRTRNLYFCDQVLAALGN